MELGLRLDSCHPVPEVWVALTLWRQVVLVWGWFLLLFLLNTFEVEGGSTPLLSLQDICTHWDLQRSKAFTQGEGLRIGPHLHVEGAQDSSVQIQGESKLKPRKSKLHLELVTIANTSLKSWRRCRAQLFWQAVVAIFFRGKREGVFWSWPPEKLSPGMNLI